MATLRSLEIGHLMQNLKFSSTIFCDFQFILGGLYYLIFFDMLRALLNGNFIVHTINVSISLGE